MKSGLTSIQAKELLKKYGLNKLPTEKTASFLNLLLRQFNSFLTYLLLFASLAAFFIGDIRDTIFILGILILNGALGFWQEYKASKELQVLKNFQVSYARVIRDGKEVEIRSEEIVPGDVVFLEAGSKVPADGQVLESYSLEINEAILTGESLPVIKTTSEKDNQLFLGTVVSSGRGRYLVAQTGPNTRFGGIAKTLTSIEGEQTPLEISLNQFVKGVGITVLIVAVVIFILRLLQGYSFGETLLGNVALFVAAVPEGLPAVITVTLALGVRNMYRKKALVRKMISVESLGAATVILSDKTGTLTKNEMRVKEVKDEKGRIRELLKCAVLCSSANLVLREDGTFDVLGDTTEGALLLWAKEQGEDIELLRSEGKLVEEIPFSLETRKMTVLWEFKDKKIEYTKGAPEVIFEEANLKPGELLVWDKEYQKMASMGLRVLAFMQDKKFLGLVGIADEVREEVGAAIKMCQQAGIKVVMVTGDSELTARSIAEEIGLLTSRDEILTGSQMGRLTDQELLEVIPKVRVFARITPENKYKLVKAYQSLGEVVAVTGDGVNDALALKQAEVGVSMGKSGTDVAKEASDIILIDDNFATLVVAVEQGRTIYANIINVVKFLMTSNFSELLLIFLAALLALPTPLLPTQILWINFVSDGLPALSLGFDKPSNVMHSPPRKSNKILNKEMIKYILVGGILIAAASLLIFYLSYLSLGLQAARAATFTGIVFLQMILPFIIRRHSITSNKKLLVSVTVILLLQVLILVTPPLRDIFGI